MPQWNRLFSCGTYTLINSHERFDFPNLELDFQMFQLMCSPFGGLKMPPKKVGTQLQVSFLSPML